MWREYVASRRRTAVFHVHFDEHDATGRIAVSAERSDGAEVQVAKKLVLTAITSCRRMTTALGQTLDHTRTQCD